MKFYIWPALLLASLLHSPIGSAEPCSVAEAGGNTILSQYEFSWEVQGTGHESGTFANGDCWIVGPVTIVDIQPASTTVNGLVRNGSQLNPSSDLQGYDELAGVGGRADFDPTLNVSPNITGSDLDVSTGSILSTQSLDLATSPGNRPHLYSAAVLTVMAATPEAGSFRPPYYGDDKTVLGTVSDLDYSVLRKLPAPTSPPSLCDLEASLERVWMEQVTDWTARSIRPTQSQENYGREMSRELGEALQSLNLNYSDSDKAVLFTRMVQYGIDIYGVARGGREWRNDGGHNHGRKMPMIMAGLALNRPEILEYADAQQHFIFHEDQSTFYVSQADIDRERFTGDGRRRDPYLQSDLGMPEWGEKHFGRPERDGRNWNAPYRRNMNSSVIGHVLTAEVMGVQDIWNHPVLFEYIERYYEIEKDDVRSAPNNLNPFDAAMYQAYGAGRVPAEDPPAAARVRPCVDIPDDAPEDCVFDLE